jgi:chromosome segregation ATPase
LKAEVKSQTETTSALGNLRVELNRLKARQQTTEDDLKRIEANSGRLDREFGKVRAQIETVTRSVSGREALRVELNQLKTPFQRLQQGFDNCMSRGKIKGATSFPVQGPG